MSDRITLWALREKVSQKTNGFGIPERFFEFQDSLCEPIQTILRLRGIGPCPSVLGVYLLLNTFLDDRNCWEHQSFPTPIRAASVRHSTVTRNSSDRKSQTRDKFGGRTMLLNTTIHALVASTQAVAAHVIAGLFVGAASPVVFAVVPKQERIKRSMRWRYLPGQPAGDRMQCCGGFSERCQNSLSRLSSRLLSNLNRTLHLGSGCLTGTSGRS